MTQRRDIQHEKPELDLKVATRRLLRAAGGTDGAAETVGSRQQRMSDCQLPNTPDFLRVDEVGRLEDVSAGMAGHPHVTRQLARRQGFELVALPSAAAPEEDFRPYACRLLMETGDVLTGLGSAMESGDGVDPKEASTLLTQADELLALVVELRQALLRRAEAAA